MKSTLFTLALAFAFSFACVARADSLDDIKNRMKGRKDAVAKLLATTNAGENNAGYLQKLNDITDAETKTLGDENADRKQVYAAISKETGENEANVGKKRAKQIADNAPAGTMLQKPDGTWYKK